MPLLCWCGAERVCIYANFMLWCFSPVRAQCRHRVLRRAICRIFREHPARSNLCTWMSVRCFGPRSTQMCIMLKGLCNMGANMMGIHAKWENFALGPCYAPKCCTACCSLVKAYIAVCTVCIFIYLA